MKQAADGVPMKHTLYIDQLTLEFWAGRRVDPARLEIQGTDRERFLNHTMDTDDAFLVAFISDLNPHDEAIREIMWREHFLVKLSWLKDRLPLLQMSEYSLYRRLRWLRLMGILESITRTVDGNKSLAYYRMSSLYWQIRARRHEEAAKAAKQVKAMLHQEHGNGKAILPAEHGYEKSHTPQGDEPYSTGTSKAIQDSQSSSPASPPSPAGALAAPPAEGLTQAVAEQAFTRIRQACGMGERASDVPRAERIRARKQLLAEQAQQLLANTGATESEGVSPPLAPDGGASGSTPPAPSESGKSLGAGGERDERPGTGDEDGEAAGAAGPGHQGERRLEVPGADQAVGSGPGRAAPEGRAGPGADDPAAERGRNDADGAASQRAPSALGRVRSAS